MPQGRPPNAVRHNGPTRHAGVLRCRAGAPPALRPWDHCRQDEGHRAARDLHRVRPHALQRPAGHCILGQHHRCPAPVRIRDALRRAPLCADLRGVLHVPRRRPRCPRGGAGCTIRHCGVQALPELPGTGAHGGAPCTICDRVVCATGVGVHRPSGGRPHLSDGLFVVVGLAPRVGTHLRGLRDQDGLDHHRWLPPRVHPHPEHAPGTGHHHGLAGLWQQCPSACGGQCVCFRPLPGQTLEHRLALDLRRGEPGNDPIYAGPSACASSRHASALCHHLCQSAGVRLADSPQ
mmetsp:Transcript_3787/g.6100  ORF Transcript_3787/g.6100 Transcript_3787/m.6100 type:complete len:291 (+) Transcript_3787:477-1349(+)